MKSAKWENWLNLILGSWLVLTPWIFGAEYTEAPTAAMDWNVWLIGLAVIVFAGMALQELKAWEEWVNLALGMWLFLSPWIFGYVDKAGMFWNSLIVGGAIAVFSGFALPLTRKE